MIEDILKQLRVLDDQRRVHAEAADQVKSQLAPINEVIKQIDDETNLMRQRLFDAMESAGEKTVRAHDWTASVVIASKIEITDQSQAVAAIAELGRVSEITKVSYDVTAIKKIAKEQPELIPGTEMVETRSIRVLDTTS